VWGGRCKQKHAQGGEEISRSRGEERKSRGERYVHGENQVGFCRKHSAEKGNINFDGKVSID